MNLTALIMIVLTQGLVSVATGYFLIKVLTIPAKENK